MTKRTVKTKQEKRLTFEDWEWNAGDADLKDIAVRMFEHGARVVVEVIARDSGDMFLRPPLTDEKGWVVLLDLRAEGMAADWGDDEICVVATPLRDLIVDAGKWLNGDDEDDRKKFETLKADVTAALAEVEESIRPRSEADMERLRNEHNELAKRFPYMTPE